MHVFTGGEFIVMGVPGHTLDDKTLSIIRHVQPLGFILFARNIKTPEQLRQLTDSLRGAVDHEPIITIDQEGGRVSRLKEFMTEPPSARQFARRADEGAISEHGSLTGKLLRLFGFNLNLAPVLDVELNAKNDNSLGERTYGNTPQQVIKNARAFLAGMTKEGILSCGKHFPGYSLAVVDPHNALPTVERSLEEMLSCEWVPFKEMLDQVDTLMIGHVSYPQIDPSNLPASLSVKMVKEMVRTDWKFKGCTITDDMDMGAINKKFGSVEAASMALAAGNDIMLVCHNIEGVPGIAEALAGVDRKIQEEAFERISALRTRLASPSGFSLAAFEKLDASVKSLRERTLQAGAAV
jgi:beta-N-acetylhexosaminidase